MSTIKKSNIFIAWCKQWIQESGQVCWVQRLKSLWGGIRRFLKKTKWRHYSLQTLKSKTNCLYSSAKWKFHEILKIGRPTKKTLAGPKGTPQRNFPSTWTELKKRSSMRSQYKNHHKHNRNWKNFGLRYFVLK